jgi:1A family penicillin-binding protein
MKRQRLKHILIDTVIVLFALSVIVIGGLLVWISTLEMPDLSAFENRLVHQSTKIYDRSGEVLLYDLHQDVQRTNVSFENISRHIKNATIAIEDDEFYNHPGIDISAIARAAFSNLQSGDLLGGQGGSTITQQVIKNALLEPEKRLTRKIKEAILSLKLEQILSKDEILTYYLNESPYGGTIYGVEEAAQAFFGVSAADVSLPQAAYLAALPQAPTRLSPYGPNRDLLEARKNQVLDRMFALDFISEKDFVNAKNADVTFSQQSISSIRAPHFVMYVRNQLSKIYGDEALAERGLRVITTLDYDLQKSAEEIVKKRTKENEEKYNASNAGMVAIDPTNGDVLTMVGSRDYFATEIDGNFNIATANRQPGSSIKPFIYAAAFTRGYLPTTTVFDVATQFSPRCEPNDRSSESPCYAPNNYNGNFLGPVNLRNALAQSLNIPAVKTLYLAGVDNALKLAAEMGISTLNDPERYGLTLVLGGGEVKLLDMTHAYGVFANEGVRSQERTILRIEDTEGNVVRDFSPQTTRVVDRNVSLMINDILADNVARTPLWGANSLVDFPDRDVAVKSGSTNNLRDAWVFGYTPNLSVGTWVGNNDNTPMGGGLSGLITTPMWREFFDIALQDREKRNFPKPKIDTSEIKPILRGDYIDSNLIAEQLGSHGTSSLNLDLISENVHNILHFVDKENPNGPYPEFPAADPQYTNWEYAVQNWRQKTFNSPESASTSTRRREEDNE